MSTATSSIQIAVVGSDENTKEGGQGCGLWPSGYGPAVRAAGGTVKMLGNDYSVRTWDHLLDGVQGVILLGRDKATTRQMAEEGRPLSPEAMRGRECRRGVPRGAMR